MQTAASVLTDQFSELLYRFPAGLDLMPPHFVSVTSKEGDLAGDWTFAEELRSACPAFDV